MRCKSKNNEKTVRVWEKNEIVLMADGNYANPYTEVEVWVDLEGPQFKRRVYGFWNGGNVFVVRILATGAGVWYFSSGSNQDDHGLNCTEGEFRAVEWSEKEKCENPCRRGMIRPTSNGHGLEFHDGTPYYLLGDTWWAAPTFRYPWHDDCERKPVGPDMGFQDMVQFRKKQGFNSIAMIAGFPAWKNDAYPTRVSMNDEHGTTLRNAWLQAGTDSAKDMHNEGGMPFVFPGNIEGYEDLLPDLDKVNPAYFQYLDRKIDYLNCQGFIPFIEVSRRDIGQVWKRYCGWPDSYARYIQYIFARYQANICLLSPIHYDWNGDTIPARDYNGPANLVVERYGAPPFGTLLGSNSNPSSLTNFGGPEEAKWLTFHQIGNSREHTHYWHLTEIYNAVPPRPALNGEPYYPGYPNDNPPATSREAAFNFRSGLYGSLLSGGFSGYIYGAEGLWAGEIEEQSTYKIWDSLLFSSGEQVQHILRFMDFPDMRYQELIPGDESVVPNRTGTPEGYRGWAYCAATAWKDYLLLYFEKDCPNTWVRGLVPGDMYRGTWFEPAQGTWVVDERLHHLLVDSFGRITLPGFLSDQDWGLKLLRTTEEK